MVKYANKRRKNNLSLGLQHLLNKLKKKSTSIIQQKGIQLWVWERGREMHTHQWEWNQQGIGVIWQEESQQHPLLWPPLFFSLFPMPTPSSSQSKAPNMISSGPNYRPPEAPELNKQKWIEGSMEFNKIVNCDWPASPPQVVKSR